MQYLSVNPSQELSIAFNKAEMPSVSQGTQRMYCVLYANVHLAGIVVKPFVYTACAVCALGATALLIIGGQFHLVPTCAKQAFLYAGCAMVAPVGQLFQLSKAALGILNPHVYFGLPGLHSYTSQLGRHVAELLRTGSLSELERSKLTRLRVYLLCTDHIGEINSHCDAHPEYKFSLPQSYLESYSILCEFFNDRDFPLDKRLEALMRLESEREQCVPGRANLLADICSGLEEPTDITMRIPWLIARYKVEVLRAICVREGHNANYCNYIFKTYGVELGLPASVIRTAKADNYAEVFESYDTPKYVIEEYRRQINESDLLNFIENYINGASASRAAFRAHILEALAQKVDDETLKAAEGYLKEKHAEAIAFEIEQERKRHEQKYQGNDIAEELVAEEVWKKTLKRIHLKENPLIDEVLYANYYYRSNPKDFEDNRLTAGAIQLFIQPYLIDLRHEFWSSPV